MQPDCIRHLEQLVGDSPLPPAARAHVLGVGGILTGLELEPFLTQAGIAASLVEQGLFAAEALPGRLGSDVAELVRDVLALPRIEALGTEHPGQTLPGQTENLRKLLLAVIRDPRVLLIHLAARLQDLRDARAAPSARQQALARVAREIHAPLANRLGIWQLKWELEDLAFRYLEPEHYRQVAAWLNQRRTDREQFITAAIATLGGALHAAGITATVTGRPKHIYSIWRKLQRKQLDFDQLYDLHALRVLVDDVTACYAALGVVHSLWHHIPREFDDYIANPKHNAYRSLHTAVVATDGRPLEIQIRSHAMHQHAEHGVAAHWRYKEGTRHDANLETRIDWMRQLLAPGGSDEDFIEQLRTELVDERIYVLTPKGDVLDLPRGATPLDFAYHVHTNVGHRCRGARVNGRLAPLTHALENGDQVDIVTARVAEPSRDWLVSANGYLTTPRARSKVRNWFRSQDRELNLRYGRETLERELDRLGLRGFRHDRLLPYFTYPDTDELFAALGTGDVTLAQLTGALQREVAASTSSAAVPAIPPRLNEQPVRGSTIRVAGMDNLASQFARCCNPVPGDAIQGYITRNSGITVHRASCLTLTRLLEKAPERGIEVSWLGDSRPMPATLIIEAHDRRGLLADLASTTTNEKIRVLALQAQPDVHSGLTTIRLSAAVSGLETLSQLLQRLARVPGVTRASRAAPG